VTLTGVELTGVGGDVFFLALTIAFFGLAWLLVKACDRISRSGDEEAVIAHQETLGEVEQIAGETELVA
jgi:hypothetical protein